MRSLVENNRLALESLRLRWALFAVLSVLFLTGGLAFLWLSWGAAYALGWLVLPALAIIYLLAVLWRGLGSNHRLGEQQLLPALGWGNHLTLLRGVLVAAMLGFLFLPEPTGWLIWIPAILYTLSDAADFFDGYVARRTNHATRLGEILDMSFDGIGVLAAATLGVKYGQLPVWYLGVAFARPLFLAGLWLRKRLGKPIHEQPPGVARRVIAGFQMGFLAAALWPVFTPPGTHIAALFFGSPLLAGFARDWLYVTGAFRLSTNNVWQAVSRWLPLGLRGAILALAAFQLAQSFPPSGLIDPLLALLILTETAIAALVALGVSGRVLSILALLLLGIHQIFAGLSPVQILLAATYTGILFLGSGRFALWTPEEYLIHHRAGEVNPYSRDAVLERG
jgi:CDP-diacylglycerol--glycerol-3-phosphate 3-phosphatidyltransferase